MWTDPRLDIATWTPPTFDQMLRLRELSGFDADARMNAACSACNDSGIREQVSHSGPFRVVVDIDCECGGNGLRAVA